MRVKKYRDAKEVNESFCYKKKNFRFKDVKASRVLSDDVANGILVLQVRLNLIDVHIFFFIANEM